MSIKVIALDLDGTLTQNRTPLSSEQREVLTALSKKYKLVMVGAGTARRIFDQLLHFPVDILGNYGMQYAEYNGKTGDIDVLFDVAMPVDKESVAARVRAFREKHGFTDFKGDSVELHPSGCVTIQLLGTKANIADKLAFDPDRSRRRAIYGEAKALFSEYSVFIGGLTSIDLVPSPYNKAYALDRYAREKGYAHDEIVYIGDDYGEGGNDEPVYKSDFTYLTIDNYLDFPKVVKHLL